MLHMMLLLTQGQLSIFGNAIKSKLERVASSLKKRPNLSHRRTNLNRSRHRTCIISWIKSINLLPFVVERTSTNNNNGSVIIRHRNGYCYWIVQKKYNVSFSRVIN